MSATASARTFGEERLAGLDSGRLERSLDEQGWCLIPDLVSAQACAELADLYDDLPRFRKTVVMARHGFGSGEYRYFDYPLPQVIASLRTALYPALAPIANRWNGQLGADERYPADHRTFLAQCAAAGQSRPTPLLLKYGPGDYNRMHQDLYGDTVFPLQLTLLLSEPGTDFTGGEFVLTEQRPRMQSRPEVVPLTRGDAVVFAVSTRPARGARGYYRLNMRHGVSRLRSGRRLAAGIIFHDAK